MPPPAISTVMITPWLLMASWHGRGMWATAKPDPLQARSGWTAERYAVNLEHSREDQMFKLYYAPGTCALASHIALAETGVPYTTEKVDFKSNQQNSPEYLGINPKGRVPALVTDRGILTETPAMLAFIRQ